MKNFFSLPLLLFLPGFVFAQQTIARWNSNQNVSTDTDGLVNVWSTSLSGPSITATSPSTPFAPLLILADSSLKYGNSVGFSPGVSNFKYMSFPTLSIDTSVVFFVGNLPALINEIHFFIGGGITGGLYQGGLFVGGTQGNIPGFGWQGAPPAYQSRITNQEPLGWNVYSFANDRFFLNGNLMATYPTAQFPALTNLNTLGGLPPNLSNISPTVKYYFSGKMAEIMILDGPLTNVRIQQISDSLTAEYNPVLTLGPDVDTCATSLRLEPLNGKTFRTYLWSTGANTRSINITQNGTYWLQVTSFGRTQRDTIIVSGLTPKPIITPGTDQRICLFQDTVNFINTSSDPGFQYAWSTGELADTIQVSSGSVYLSATNLGNGCTLYSDTVELLNKVKADFSNPAACPGTDAQLLNLSVDFGGDTLVSHFWNFGDPSTFLDVSTDSNGVWNYAQSGTYPVFYRVTSSDGCADSITKNLLIKPSATPNFTWQGLCYGKPTQFFDQSLPENGTQVTGYQWNFGPGINSSFVNPALSFDTAGTYPVSLTVYTASGCNETIVQQVPVNKGVIADFSIADSLCAGQAVNALDLSTGVNDALTGWVWRFGSNPPILGQNPSFAFQNTGVRVVRLTVTTAAGCTDSIQTNVFVKPSPTANFNLAQQGGNPPFLPTVNNLSTGADTYLWSSGNFSDMGFEPAFPVFSDTGTFAITLVALNEEGCSDTVSRNIIVFTGNRSLELFDATCTRNGDFMEYTARILNKGALDVSDIRLEANTGYNEVVQETWTGSLTPGQILNYSFVSSTKLFTQDEFCCVRIKSFNDSLLVSSPDDEICLPLSSEVWFSNAYPQPVTGVFSVDYTLPFAGEITASISDMAGKSVKMLWDEQTVLAGFGSIQADISELRSGIYLIRISYRDKEYTVKLVKR